MSRVTKGRNNEHRSIAYLAKRGYIALRASASKGAGGTDVIGANLTTGEVRIVQSKSNHHYGSADIEQLRILVRSTHAHNVQFELHDWYDGYRHPIITVVGHDQKDDKIIITDPKMRIFLKCLHETSS